MKSIVFPGQGSQYVGMGKDLFDSFPEVKVIFEEVNNALDQNLSSLIFNGPDDELTLTENAQPAIMTVGIAIIEILVALLQAYIFTILSALYFGFAVEEEHDH